MLKVLYTILFLYYSCTVSIIITFILIFSLCTSNYFLLFFCLSVNISVLVQLQHLAPEFPLLGSVKASYHVVPTFILMHVCSIGLPSKMCSHQILQGMLCVLSCWSKPSVTYLFGIVLTQGLAWTLLAFGPFHTEYYICGGMCVWDGQTVSVSSGYM